MRRIVNATACLLLTLLFAQTVPANGARSVLLSPQRREAGRPAGGAHGG